MRQRFRRILPIVLSVALLVFWWAIFPVIGPVSGVYDISQPIHYWSFITPDRIRLVVVWFLFMVLAAAGAISAFRLYRGWLFALSWLMIALAILSSLLVMFLYLFIHDDTELQHVQTVDYGGHQYHLAVRHHPYEWDYTLNTYIVFECDSTGDTCRELTRLPPDIDPQEASLSLSNNQTMLFLKQGQNQIQIRP